MVEGLRVRGCPGARGPRRRHHGDPLVGEVERHLLAAHVQQRLLRRAAGHPAPGAAAAAHLLAPRDVAPGPGLLQAAAVQVAEGGGQRLYARPLLVLLTHTTIIYFKILFIYIQCVPKNGIFFGTPCNKIVIINAYFIK